MKIKTEQIIAACFYDENWMTIRTPYVYTAQWTQTPINANLILHKLFRWFQFLRIILHTQNTTKHRSVKKH